MEMLPERFPAADVSTLRDDLRHSGLDSWQGGQLITAFLATRGYGISSDEARKAATRLEASGCNVPCIQQELEALAFLT